MIMFIFHKAYVLWSHFRVEFSERKWTNYILSKVWAVGLCRLHRWEQSQSNQVLFFIVCASVDTAIPEYVEIYVLLVMLILLLIIAMLHCNW